MLELLSLWVVTLRQRAVCGGDKRDEWRCRHRINGSRPEATEAGSRETDDDDDDDDVQRRGHRRYHIYQGPYSLSLGPARTRTLYVTTLAATGRRLRPDAYLLLASALAADDLQGPEKATNSICQGRY